MQGSKRLSRRWNRIFLGVQASIGILTMSLAFGAKIPPQEYTSQIRIRVRLTEAIPRVRVRGFDLRIHEMAKVAARTDGLSEWELTCFHGMIRAISTHSVKWLDLHEPVTVESPAGFLNFQNRPFRQILHISSVGSQCEVVNEVELEKYLDGLVNAEFSAKWNAKAMAAQVIAARTYAVHRMGQARLNPGSRFDIDATVRDQVYDGSMREDFRASRAVDRTRGLVLMTQFQEKGEKKWIPLKAFYHSTCGGATEFPERVWGNPYPGFKKVVRCPFCAVSPSFRWSAEISNSQMAEVVQRGVAQDGVQRNWPKAALEFLRHGTLASLFVSRWGTEGRAAQVTVVWHWGQSEIQLPIPAPRFRGWFGASVLRSTFFQISPISQGHWRFDGRGSGHGVGLCQWGAKNMGERGYSAASILHYYYPGSTIRKLW